MNDIEIKRSVFLSLLKEEAHRWNVGRLYKSIIDWFNTHSIDKYGYADIGVSYEASGDVGDNLFNTMYEVQTSLKCAAGVLEIKKRYKPKVVDGVVYVAMRNPFDIHWRVNIGAISLEAKKE